MCSMERQTPFMPIKSTYREPRPYQVQFDNTSLAAASSMAIAAGGQSFVITNIGAGSSNTLVYLNGNRSTLGVWFGQGRAHKASP